MALNNLTINCKFPFDMEYNEEKNFLMGSVAVKRDFKKEDETYYPEDIIPIKAFGPKAKFLHDHFQKGSFAILSGRLEKGEDYTDKNGDLKSGMLFMRVETINFVEAPKGENSTNTQSSAKNTSTPAPRAKGPAGLPGKKPGIPGKKPGFPPFAK